MIRKALTILTGVLVTAGLLFLPAATPSLAASCSAAPQTFTATSSNWITNTTNSYNWPATTGGIQIPQQMLCDSMSLTFGSSPSWSNNASVTLYCGATPIGSNGSFGTSSTVTGVESGVCDQNSPTGASWYLNATFATGSAPLTMTGTITWSGNQLAQIPQTIIMPAGNANVEGHETDVPSGSIMLYRFQGVNGSPFFTGGDSTVITTYANTNTTSTVINMGIYAESSGTPARLIRACNGPQAIAAAPGWTTCSINPYHLTFGMNYWLALFTADVGHTTAMMDDSASVATEAIQSSGWTLQTAGTTNGLPNTWTSSGHTQTTPSVRNGSIATHP